MRHINGISVKQSGYFCLNNLYVWIAVNNNNERKCDILSCPIGHGIYPVSGSQCVYCRVGQYQNYNTKKVCDLCPSGYTTTGENSIFKQDCKIIIERDQRVNAHVKLTYILNDCQKDKIKAFIEKKLGEESDTWGIGKWLSKRTEFVLKEVKAILETMITSGKFVYSNTNPQDTSVTQVYSCSRGHQFLTKGCMPCDVGHKEEASVCVKCPADYFQNRVASTECIKCDSAKTSLPGSTVCVDKCPSGYKSDGSNCIKCGFGYYRKAEVHLGGKCIKCKSGSTTNSETAESQLECVCQKGFKQTSTMECLKCPINEYQDKLNQTFCIKCPDGYGTLKDTSMNIGSCKKRCPPGEESLDNINCTECKRGFFKVSMDIDVKCKKCPFDKTTYSAGSQSCDASLCSPGNKLIATGECQKCDYGEYQDEMDKKECKLCDPNYSTQDRGSTNKSNCKRLCENGYYRQKDLCIKCEKGYYRRTTNATKLGETCTKCPIGKTTKQEGSDNIALCIYDCSEGQKQTNSGCEDCKIGYYQDEKYATDCKKCPDGLTTLRERSKDKTDCILICGKGEYADSDSCKMCKKGFYKEFIGPMSCHKCPENFSTIGEGSKSAADCTEPDCGPGRYLHGSVCLDCDYGFYHSTGFTRKCDECPVNMTTIGTKARSENECYENCESGMEIRGSSCTKCIRGYYRKLGLNGKKISALCTLCPANKTTSDIGAAECDVLLCAPGTYPKGECTPCEAGTFQPSNIPLTENTKCIPCGKKKTSPTGSKRESDCYSTDECASGTHNCNAFEICEDLELPDTFTCQCKNAYLRDKGECKDKCLFDYCKNGGFCYKINDNQTKCNCTSGYSGTRCEVSYDILLIVLCVIGGVLVFVLLLVVIICYCKRRSRPTKKKATKEKPTASKETLSEMKKQTPQVTPASNYYVQNPVHSVPAVFETQRKDTRYSEADSDIFSNEVKPYLPTNSEIQHPVPPRLPNRSKTSSSADDAPKENAPTRPQPRQSEQDNDYQPLTGHTTSDYQELSPMSDDVFVPLTPAKINPDFDDGEVYQEINVQQRDDGETRINVP
ncbi:DgyrCDS13035 [Dimorphilus gyrociliatus]|uniref:DgyrCDS13035 n=1 Tax=Dimorphilus gyrociliatus TaxID=2664684 RepID=A0A7I8W9I6_9ANNE|nr:DgyrCDS13035 [Dimorphilus gyrociliatus]